MRKLDLESYYRAIKTLPQVKALVEALKEGGRLVLLAIVPTLIAGINTQNGNIAINWALVKALALSEALVFLLKMLDKGKHIYGKETETLRSGESRGLIPF